MQTLDLVDNMPTMSAILDPCREVTVWIILNISQPLLMFTIDSMHLLPLPSYHLTPTATLPPSTASLLPLPSYNLTPHPPTTFYHISLTTALLLPVSYLLFHTASLLPPPPFYHRSPIFLTQYSFNSSCSCHHASYFSLWLLSLGHSPPANLLSVVRASGSGWSWPISSPFTSEWYIKQRWNSHSDLWFISLTTSWTQQQDSSSNVSALLDSNAFHQISFIMLRLLTWHVCASVGCVQAFLYGGPKLPPLI